MKVPDDCKYCRHQNREEVCKQFREGEACTIPYAGDAYVTAEFDAMTYGQRVIANEKFHLNYGVEITTQKKRKQK